MTPTPGAQIHIRFSTQRVADLFNHEIFEHGQSAWLVLGGLSAALFRQQVRCLLVVYKPAPCAIGAQTIVGKIATHRRLPFRMTCLMPDFIFAMSEPAF